VTFQYFDGGNATGARMTAFAQSFGVPMKFIAARGLRRACSIAVVSLFPTMVLVENPANGAGVDPNVTLKLIPQDARSGPGWKWDSRGWVSITGPSTVFEGFSTAGTVQVDANGVVIRNVKVVHGGNGWGIRIDHAKNTTISNCEVGGLNTTTGRLSTGIGTVYGDEGDVTVQSCDIYFTKNGINLSRGLVEDNVIRRMGSIPGDHVNSITSNVSTGKLTIRHNRLLNQIPQTDAIGLFQDFGGQHDVVIDSNYVSGGGYTIYGGAGATKTYNIVITNNRFGRDYYVRSGYWGPAAYFDKTGSGNAWSNNSWADTGKLIAAP
jgi:hypothetical protein